MSERLSRAVSRLVDTPDATPLAVKVPEITALFWVIKVTSTAMGEALGDFLDGGAGLIWPAIGAVTAFAVFILALRIQLRTPRYQAAAYWFAIAMVATFGTMVADSLHQFLALPYWLTTLFYAGVLAVVFRRWWVHEHTLSIHSIDTRRREHFYWATVLATFALGTAAGDWTATNLNLGFLSSGLLFAGVIAVPAIAYRLGASSIVTFWFAYITTRPLGASFADWFDYPRRASGLGVGTAPVWAVLSVVMVGLVTVLARRERVARSRPSSDAVDEPVAARPAHHGHAGHGARIGTADLATD
jgi:uncharacterized membrane-anchored protein